MLGIRKSDFRKARNWEHSYILDSWRTMDSFGIWGNQWDAPGGNNRGVAHSAAFNKLSRSPSKGTIS